METIGARIRERRKQVGMSMVTLADKVGCSRSLIAKLEHGEREEFLKKYFRIAKALECRIDDLNPEMDMPAESEGAMQEESKTARACGFDENEDLKGWSE